MQTGNQLTSNNVNFKAKPNSSHDLEINEIITRWDEAIPLGNGLTGCLIWGDGSPLRFSLDRGDLWDKRAAPETEKADFTYEKLIELVEAKDEKSIKQQFDGIYNKPTPTKIPAGRIELDYGKPCNCAVSNLSLNDALAEVKLDFDSSYSIVKSFLHAYSKFGYITVEGNIIPQIKVVGHKFHFDKDISFKKKADVTYGLLGQLDYPPAEYGEDGEFKWFYQKTLQNLEFGIVLAVRECVNVYNSNNENIANNKRIEIAYVVASSYDGENWLDDIRKILKQALEDGYDKVLKNHKIWWHNFWSKSSIDLPDKMFEKQWYLTNYLFGSCSRKGSPPMPLQGVWTADEESLPPWKGDYHNDLNTQLSYLHYLKANHLEEGESFTDFLWNLVPQARKFAEEFFDAPGICLPSVMSIDGKPLGGWVQYSINLTNQAWLCQAFEHYWKYTGDDNFLQEKAYPYFKWTAECILRWLKPGKDGKLVLPLSSSPEIHDNSMDAWLTPNSNYDLSLLIYLFKTLSEMSSILENGEKSGWDEIIGKLPDLAVNGKKILMLSPVESLDESHRHHSHAMAIYPLCLLDYNKEQRKNYSNEGSFSNSGNYDNGGSDGNGGNGNKDITDKEIIDATVSNLELLGTGLWVGYSFPWMAEFYAKQGNGEGAAYQLKLFWECFCSKNGFHLNGDYMKRGVSAFHYRPFTLEGNMCAADVLQEMLLQTYNGIIRVFPAIPEEWAKSEVSFSGFRGESGIIISSKIKAGNLEYILLG
jgi:alpha-L-fucosidase 2